MLLSPKNAKPQMACSSMAARVRAKREVPRGALPAGAKACRMLVEMTLQPTNGAVPSRRHDHCAQHTSFVA